MKDEEDNGSPMNKLSAKQKEQQSFAKNNSIGSVDDSGTELLKIKQILPTK